jgi:FdhE protein
MAGTLEPDPSMIGGVAKAPFALLPVAMTLFQERAKRFAFLAQTSELKPYLDFLAALTRLQARLVAQLTAVQPLPRARLAHARAANMPPIDRAALADGPALHDTLAALIEGAADLTMPDVARLALAALRAADREDRAWLLDNVLSDTFPEDSVAPHLFAATAVQVHLARLAGTLVGNGLVPVGTGLCPACGGRPVTSSVRGEQGVENVRYATCACCATRWNEVRVKCLCCGSTKGLTYRSAETHDATVKAECCAECGSWVKILYQVKNPTLDPVADDVGSLGLDMLMKETPFRRAGFNPYLVGY